MATLSAIRAKANKKQVADRKSSILPSMVSCQFWSTAGGRLFISGRSQALGASTAAQSCEFGFDLAACIRTAIRTQRFLKLADDTLAYLSGGIACVPAAWQAPSARTYMVTGLSLAEKWITSLTSEPPSWSSLVLFWGGTPRPTQALRLCTTAAVEERPLRMARPDPAIRGVASARRACLRGRLHIKDQILLKKPFAGHLAPLSVMGMAGHPQLSVVRSPFHPDPWPTPRPELAPVVKGSAFLDDGRKFWLR